MEKTQNGFFDEKMNAHLFFLRISYEDDLAERTKEIKIKNSF